MTEDKQFLPKLEKVLSLVIYGYQGKKLMIFTDKYSQTIKTLSVALSYMDMRGGELKTCIDCIGRFENLKELRLGIRFYRKYQPIDDCLSLIGQKCNKLFKLDLFLDKSVPLSKDFFEVFSEFKAIKKLRIALPNRKVLSGSVECFKHCKQLIDIDITYDKLREDFFANIASFVPKLQLLKIVMTQERDLITTIKQYSDSFIDSFHPMKNLQRASITFTNQVERYHENKYWFFGKSLSEVMLSPNGMNVKHITHNCGLIIDLKLWAVL